jgi:HlyD family secretion protein
VEVVDVGAQVAGLIQSFGEDIRDESKSISYGSPVKEGTILARLDDALFKARVDQSRAQLDRAKADVQQAKASLWQAERELERSRNLRSRNGAVSAQEYDAAQAEVETSRAGLAVAEASVGLAEANLEEARVNLGYTTIRSPVAGVILDRRVNIGQTVVASLNAPSLFLIAKDLSRMEIWASVNEADIGAIHVGHEARFTVAPFPDRSFRGEVSQIRLNASMVHNVVTYTVVIEVDNADGKLLPYLTARVQFQVEERPKVLLVPNVALRFRPRAEHIAPSSQSPRSNTPAGSPDSDGGPAGDRDATGPRTRGSLWVRQGDLVRPVAVQLGATDGLRTEVMGEGLAEGLDVVIGEQLRDVGVASPFLPNFKKSARTR